uniref:Uncharacterized protein n=1 Tax=Oryza barthii TaxID=65489 RepID=A0A0D3FKE8_9ORYZ
MHTFGTNRAVALNGASPRSTPPLALPPSLTPATTARDTTAISFAIFHSTFSLLAAS